MSDIQELWKEAKAEMEKSALSPSAAKNAVAPILRAFGKAPALGSEVTALSKAAPNALGTELGAVSRNIDEAAGAVRPAKGRVIEPPTPPGSQAAGGGPKLLPAPATQLSGGGGSGGGIKSLGDHWRGLSDRTRSGIKSTGLIGAGGLAGEVHGNSRGKATGMEVGSAQGYDAGVADASARASQMSVDPGILGRLMEVFTGRQPTAVNAMDPEMAARRRAALQRILAGG